MADNNTQMEELKKKILTLKDGMKITQIVASRVMKNREGGDVFVSLTANYDGELSLRDSKIASHLLALEVQTQALEQSVAAGITPPFKLDAAKKALMTNFTKLIVDTKGEE
jgi:hypothetical protein